MNTEQLDHWDELRALCASIMSVPVQDVVPQARLVADLGADSLDITELQAASEDHFDVSVKGVDPASVCTIGDVAVLIERLRTAQTSDAVTG
ncbi:acyl carrier protein [Streptomyces longisporoflavus]|uniref:acyl carrier protein n=1 Tax=Streptomyces longisporoflavus TaxID=28044 RepID=UPI0019AA437E|nr:phosphopantetheine-binding protein [Streptomyces longisporoflavus]GGV71337.1 acyl carrier protein [Streptomyces longisporoflavus]